MTSWLRHLTIAALMAAVSAGQTAGEVALYLTDGNGDPTRVEIAPGAAFDVHVGLGTASGLIALSFQLTVSDNGSGRFSIIQRVVSPQTPLPDLISDDAAVIESQAGLLDPTSDRDLGGLLEDLTVEPPPGVYPLAVLTIRTSPDIAPGTYSLSPVPASGTSWLLEDLPVTVHDYTIIVVPPGTNSEGTTEGSQDAGSGDNTGGTDTGGNQGSGTSTDTGGGTDSGTGSDTGANSTGGNTGSTAGGSGSTDGSSTDGQAGETNNPPQSSPLSVCGGGTATAIVPMMLGFFLMRRRR
ncbi:MAG: hypothetical protein HRF43_03710 [Phycisphaerae bacterium]|jgi:hypothetical protein